MSAYSNTNPNEQSENYWNNDGHFEMNTDDFGNQQQLNFQSFDQSVPTNNWQNQYSPLSPGNVPLDPNASRASFLDPAPMYYGEGAASFTHGANMGYNDVDTATDSFEDEPPLMEELGIHPERIMEKTIAALNPFRRLGPTDDVNFLLQDSDLAGPLMFCIALGAFLLCGGKVNFGYVYGLAVTCCLMMYALLTLMSHTTPSVSLLSVASILGYCILPIVGLSAYGIFFTLRSLVGMALTIFAVAWCSLSSSRLFVTILSDPNQRLLIAYPCALLYAAFALIAMF